MIENAIKKSGVFIALMMAAVLSYALLVTPNNASATAPIGVNGGSVEFNKYLVMDENATVPNATYQFTIEAGVAVPASGDAPAVMAGPVTGTAPSINPTAATFSSTDTTFDSVQTGDSVALASGQKYAKETLTVDLSGVEFTAPGIYRYKITESGDDPNILNDTNQSRYLDVYVASVDDGDGLYHLSINKADGGGYVLHPTTDIQAGGEYDNKDDGFTQVYNTRNLTLQKLITGNQGNKNKIFKFTVTIGNTTAGTRYTVSGLSTGGTITYNGQTVTNPTEATVATGQNSVAIDLYLTNLNTVTIGPLLAGNTYSISEVNEDYTASYTIDNGSSVAGNAFAEPQLMQPFAPGGEVLLDFDNHEVVFTNDRSGTVPTGILLNIAPYAIVFMLSGAAIVLVLARKRKTSVR